MVGRENSLERERNGAIWREGGGGADRFGRRRERDRDLNVSLLDTQEPDCAADRREGREGRKVTKPRMNVASALS